MSRLRVAGVGGGWDGGGGGGQGVGKGDPLPAPRGEVTRGKAGEWESILEGVRGAAGLDVHHLIERRFAGELGLDADDIPGVVLDRAYHQHITARLFSILQTNQEYDLQRIWNTYKEVYRALGHEDWLKAIWPYFKDKGVKR